MGSKDWMSFRGQLCIHARPGMHAKCCCLPYLFWHFQAFRACTSRSIGFEPAMYANMRLVQLSSGDIRRQFHPAPRFRQRGQKDRTACRRGSEGTGHVNCYPVMQLTAHDDETLHVLGDRNAHAETVQDLLVVQGMDAPFAMTSCNDFVGS